MEKIYTSKDHSADIMGSIAQLWQNNKYCDAVLEIGSEKLECHRIILLAASPSILNVLSSPDEDKIMNFKLNLDETYLEAVHLCLKYLYEGTVKLTEENVHKVIKIAQTLYLKELVMFCSNFQKLQKDLKDVPVQEQNIISEQPILRTERSQKRKENIYLEKLVEASARVEEIEDNIGEVVDPLTVENILQNSRNQAVEELDRSCSDRHIREYIENCNKDSAAETDFHIVQSSTDTYGANFGPDSGRLEIVSPSFQYKLDKSSTYIAKLKRPIYSPSTHARKKKSSIIKKGEQSVVIEANVKAKNDKADESLVYTEADMKVEVDTEASIKDNIGLDSVNSAVDGLNEEELLELKEKMYPNLWREFSTAGASKECNMCGKVYHSYNGYWKHIRKHFGKARFECSICGKGYNDKMQLDGHMNKHAAVQPYYCPYCPKQFSYRHSLLRHIRKCPDSTSPGQGISFARSSKDISEPAEHKVTNESVEASGSGDGNKEAKVSKKKVRGKKVNAVCHICGKHLLSGNGLYRHLLKHEGIFKYTCAICGRGFMDRVHYEGHVNGHKNIKAYSCPKCKMKFTFLSSCRKHVSTCTKTEFSYIKKKEAHLCVHCGASFKRKENHNEHVRAKHSGTVELVTCGACGKAWKWKSNKNKHLRNSPECRRIVSLMKERMKQLDDTKNTAGTAVRTDEVPLKKGERGFDYPVPGQSGTAGPVHHLQENIGTAYDNREQVHQSNGNRVSDFDNRKQMQSCGLDTEDQMINYAKEIMNFATTGHELL